jgi:hypothetical protein
VKPFSAAAAADRLPPWQNPARLRQFAGTVGLLGLLYGVLAVIALLGGPRIGASFLPLPGGGPDPAGPVAGLQPGRPTQNIPTIPHATTSPTPSPVVPPPSTPLPTATIPGVTVAGQVRTPATPCPTATPGDPTAQLADEYNPTIPVATKTPPSRPTTTTDPQRPPTSKPTDDPATPPPTTTPPSDPPSTPDDPPPPPDDPPPPPDGPSLGGLLGALLDKLGL